MACTGRIALTILFQHWKSIVNILMWRKALCNFTCLGHHLSDVTVLFTAIFVFAQFYIEGFNFTKSIHFFLLAFASLRRSPKNGILCSAISFSALGVFEHPATTHLSGIFSESFEHKIPSQILQNIWQNGARRIGASWHDVTARSSTQTLSCGDSRSSSLGVAEAGALKLDFGGKTTRNPKILFGVVIYGL